MATGIRRFNLMQGATKVGEGRLFATSGTVTLTEDWIGPPVAGLDRVVSQWKPADGMTAVEAILAQHPGSRVEYVKRDGTPEDDQ